MIIPWWVGTFIASACGIYMNIYFRVKEISLFNTLKCLPIIIIINFGFWYGLRQSPSFILTFLLMVGIPFILNVIIGILYFKETIELRQFIGIILIMLGITLNGSK